MPLRRSRRPRLAHRAYAVALILLGAALLVVALPTFGRPRLADLPVVVVFGALAVLSRRQRLGPWRMEAATITPAFGLATLLLAGAGAALLVVGAAYAIETWTGSTRRPHPLFVGLTQGVAVLATTIGATRVLHLTPGTALHRAGLELLAVTLVYWACSEALGLPTRAVTPHPRDLLLGGLREEGAMALLLCMAAVTLAVLWSAGALPFICGLATLVLLNRSVSSSHFGRETLVEPKTGLFNARYFQEVTEAELQRCRRLERPASVLMCDLDHLREINNRHGHPTGDLVIKRVAEIIRSNTRNFDVPSRFGGEEFAILLPETSRRRARVIAERLRQGVAAERFQPASGSRQASGQPFGVTISIRVAAFPEDARTAEALLARADEAAYAAKNAGRNQVVVSGGQAELGILPAAR